MVPWCIMPSARMITHNAKLGCERARINPHVLFVELSTRFSKSSWQIFNTPETNEESKELAAFEKESKQRTAGHSTTTAENRSETELVLGGRLPPEGTQPAHLAPHPIFSVARSQGLW